MRPRKRFERHLKDARESKSTGGADCIRAIQSADHQPKLMVWKWFDTEQEAKEAEARFKELLRSRPNLNPRNRHTGLETGANEEDGRAGGLARKQRMDADPKFAERMREVSRKSARKMNAHPAMHEARRKGGRVSKGGRHIGALYGRDDLVRYIRKQDPGRGSRKPRSRELAAEIERDHGVRVNSCSIRRIWYGKRYTHVK